MSGQDLVRPSRDGDQFHYHWAARKCLELLPGVSDLVAVTIEGPSKEEAGGDEIVPGDQLIDVGLYFGAEGRSKARLVQYVQLKHSTRQTLDDWTASGLTKTIGGFAQRFAKLLKDLPADDVAQRFRFVFATNRPIRANVQEALSDLAEGASARHPKVREILARSTSLDEAQTAAFFRLFSTTGSERNLWEQRILLSQDTFAYLPDADRDAPVQLKELVTRKATTEFESNPSIRRHDVLRALNVTDEQLAPAPCLVEQATGSLPREQELAILSTLLTSQGPLILHAEGGVGKSVLAARLVKSMPSGSVAILYDCFGAGRYRDALHLRHRHRDALVQIANELAARGLCYPLIPSVHADEKAYMQAFLGRLTQALWVVRANDANAQICLIIDAADNAAMAAEERREPASFVRDLIRASLPIGVRLAFTCRTHRRGLLQAAPGEAQEVELRPFTQAESARHLRKFHPGASDTDVTEFAVLSSSNPRVQAYALSGNPSLAEVLKNLGPEPTTVDRAISEQLETAVARLRDQSGIQGASQIDSICQGLSILRPLVPVPVLALLSDVSESAIRTFAFDFGRGLVVKGNSLHFIDEPTETWFRDRFRPDAIGVNAFVERLRPLAAKSSYAAGALPQLLLQANKLDELVELALSEDRLPTENPMEKRDVELQRLMFALKACLRHRKYVAASKLALKAGGECAGEERQNRLLQENTDLAGLLMAPDRVADIMSRRTFRSTWMGSHHAYYAGLLSGTEELRAEASSRLRMAEDWLDAWSRRAPSDGRTEQVSSEDTAELAMALLRLRDPQAAARFLKGWTPRHHTLEAARCLGRRLIDLGRYEQVDALAEAAANDPWLLLGLATEARDVGRVLPARPLTRLLRLLAHPRIDLPRGHGWNSEWIVLNGVRAAIEIGMRVLTPARDEWAAVLRRYLPAVPPPTIASRFNFERTPLLPAYALEAALRGDTLKLMDVAPPDVRGQLEKGYSQGRSQQAETFLLEAGTALPWLVLSSEITCGRCPPDLAAAIDEAGRKSAEVRGIYREDHVQTQRFAIDCFRILVDAGSAAPDLATFLSHFRKGSDAFAPEILISLCRSAARAEGYESLAVSLAEKAYGILENARGDAGMRANSLISLARSILVVSSAEARVYFDRAAEIAGRIGDENLDRWSAFLNLGIAAGKRDTPKPRTAYRMSRFAELTYTYVDRDKHFPWERTVETLTDLCGSSAFAILSRWRDRRFGESSRLLPTLVYRLVEQGRLPATAPIALAGVTGGWDRLADLRRAVRTEGASGRRSLLAKIAFRYIRVAPGENDRWRHLQNLATEYGLDLPGLDRLIAFEPIRRSKGEGRVEAAAVERSLAGVDWNAIFQGLELTDAAALRSAYDAIRAGESRFPVENFFREALARVKIGRESEFICAISTWPDFGIVHLRHLVDALSVPIPKQLSLRKAIRDAVLLVCQREPLRVHRRGWFAVLPLERLHKEGVVADRDVAVATLEGFAAQADGLTGGAVFQMLESLAITLSQEGAEDVLNFGLDLLEKVIRPDDGDGPWRPELDPDRTVTSALASYVWVGLGSPTAAERWQYAHVVRSVVELGWNEVLDALVASARRGAPNPFVDGRLAFYSWHARQWLLIGLARGGLENPAALRGGRSFLRACLGEDHVVIRDLAAKALRALVLAGEENLETAELDSINRPSLPEVVHSRWSESMDDETPSAEQAGDEGEEYYFGIDFGPYWFAPLGRVFGLAEKAIERRALGSIHVLRRADGSEPREDARRSRRVFGDGETYHSQGTLPRVDDLAAYHAYHAMMMVAASLLRERCVRRNAEEASDQFAGWLSEYLLPCTDGRWPADRRSPRLVRDPPPRKRHDDNEWRWSVTADYLDRQLVTDDGMTALWGSWTGGEDDYSETICLRSALVSRVGADALLASLQTAPILGRFSLPSAERGSRVEFGVLRLAGWVSHERLPGRLGRDDPWGEEVRCRGPEPSKDTMARLGLVERANEHAWTCSSDGLLRSESWTHVRGYGGERETLLGERLGANRGFLRHFLDAYPGDRLIVSVEIRRSLPRRVARDDEVDFYLQDFARYYIMGVDGVAHALRSCP